MGYNRQERMKRKFLKLLTMLLFMGGVMQAQTSEVPIIYGYLYVFPSVVGSFDSEPYNVIRQINAQSQFGVNSWRIPTKEEVSLMNANGYCDNSETYMTSDGSSYGIVRLVTTKSEIEKNAQQNAKKQQQDLVKTLKAQTGHIDLGLPSGTKWAAQPKARYYKYDEASSYNLPSQNQWEELKNYCTWTWVDGQNGYIVKGRNGNAIFLRGTYGQMNVDIHLDNTSGNGTYWTSTYAGSSVRGSSMYYSFTFSTRSSYFSRTAVYDGLYVITVSQ